MVTIYLAPRRAVLGTARRSAHSRRAGRRYRRGQAANPGTGPDAHSPSIRPCSRWGLAAAVSPQATGRSYRPISTLPPTPEPALPPMTWQNGRPVDAGGGMFLCHFPSPASVSQPLRKPGSYPAPCPEEPGLSSPARLPPPRRSPGLAWPLQCQSSIGGYGGQGRGDSGPISKSANPLILSLSKDGITMGRMVRQAHHERVMPSLAIAGGWPSSSSTPPPHNPGTFPAAASCRTCLRWFWGFLR